MPVVPRTEGPNVRRALPSGGFNTTRANANAFGGQMAKAYQSLGADIGQAANEIEKQVIQIKKEDDTNAVMEAENQLLNWEAENLHNPEGGYFTTQGKNAMGGVGRIPAEYKRRAGEVYSQLQNDDQRMAFNKIAMQRQQSIQTSVAQHEAKQRKVLLQDNAEALQAMSIDGAASSYTDPNAVAFHMQTGIRAIMAHGMSQGQSEMVIQQKIKEFTGDAHGAVLERMVDDNPTEAMKYFEANRDQMNAKTAESIEGKLEGAVNKELSRQYADEILNGGGSVHAQLAKARKIKDTDVSDETVRRLKILHTEQKAARAAAVSSAWDTVYKNPTIDAIPNWVKGEERQKMLEYVTTLGTKPGNNTDYVYYNELIQMTPEQLANTQIDPTRLKETHLKQFLDARAKAINGDTSGNFDTNNIVGVAKEFAVQSGFSGKEKMVGQFTARLREEVEAEKAAKGGNLLYSEVKNIADRLMLTADPRDGWFNGGPKFAFEVDIQGLARKYVDEAAVVFQKNGKQPRVEEMEFTIKETLKNEQELKVTLQNMGVPATMPNMLDLQLRTLEYQKKAK